MSLQLHVDFDADDWTGYQKASDPANMFEAGSVDMAALYYQAPTAGASYASGSLFARYSDDRAKYGKRVINWTTGTATPAYIIVGSDGVNFTLSAVPAGTYTVVMWAKLASGSSVNTFRIDLTNVLTTTYASSSSATLNSSTWTKFSVTGTTPSPQQLAISFVRATGSTNLSVQITGAMIVNSATAPAYFNCGVASLLEDITEYWGGGKWGLGFVRPYQYVAPVGKADLTLMNSDKRFSPEYSSGDLYGELMPGRLLQIGDPNYGIWWTGWTESWSAEPGTSRDKKAKLTATDARRFIDHVLPYWPLQQATLSETNPSALISTLMGLTDLPSSSIGVDTDIDFDGFSFLGSEGPSYYADDNPEGADITKILADILAGVQGHLWFNREGQYVRCQMTGDTGSYSHAVDGSWIDAEYILDRLVNACDITVHPKKRETSSTTIWELDDEITLAAGASDITRVYFRNTTSNKEIVGADNLATSGFTLASGTVPTHVTVTLSEEGAQSALMTIENISALSRTVNAGTVTGRKVIARRTLVKSYEDATSIAAFGRENVAIDSHWVSDRTYAAQFAKYMVTRWKDARYVMKTVDLDCDVDPQLGFDCYMGKSIRVTDSQTAHSLVYGIIGEVHTVRDGLTDHTVKLYLEPLYDDYIRDMTLP